MRSDHKGGRRGLPVVCPRCGLKLSPRVTWMQATVCPRCIAIAHKSVTLVAIDTTPAEHQTEQPQH